MGNIITTIGRSAANGIADAYNSFKGEIAPDAPDTSANTKALDDYAAMLAQQAKDYQDIVPQQVGVDAAAVGAAQSKYDAAKIAYDAAVAKEMAGGGANSANTGAMGTRMDPVTGQVVAGRGPSPEVAAAKAALDAARVDLNTARTTIDPRNLSGPAQTVTAPADVTTTTIADKVPAIDFNAGLVAQQIAPGQQVTAQGVAQPQGVSAQQISTPGGISATQVAAERIAGASINPNSIANIDTSTSVGRQAQLGVLSQLQDAAAGKTPSAAEWLLRKGIDENVGTAYGLAASLQGRNTGGALRAGQIAARDAIAKSSADMAALRAKEQADARQAVATLGTAISETDYKAAASNQTKDLTVSVENLRAEIEKQKANADNALRAGMANQAADIQAKIATLQSQVEVAKANASNSLTADIATMTAKLDASKADAANNLAAQITNANNELTRLTANQSAALTAGRANQADSLAAEIARTQQQLDAARADQSAMLEAAKATASNQLSAATDTAKLAQQNSQFNAGQNLDISKTNTSNQLEIDKANEAIRLAIEHEALAGLGASASAAGAEADRQTKADAQWSAFLGSILEGGGKVAAAAAGKPG
jgi:hypothetical protein